MAIPGTDTGATAAPSARTVSPPPAAATPAPFGPTVALTVTLAVACFAVVTAVVELVIAPTPLPSLVPGVPPQGTENQHAESALYVIAFALILPAALIAVPRFADAIAAGPNARVLSPLTAILAATLAASAIVARVLPDGGGVVDVLGVLGLWWLGALVVLGLARGQTPWELLLRVAHRAPFLWACAGVLVLIALLDFTSLGSISAVPVALGAVAVPALLVLDARRGDAGLPGLPRRLGVAVDGAIIVVLLLAIPDLVIFSSSNPLAAFETSVAQFHQNFVLGPTNVVLHGGAVLVDTASQYGVGSIYFLAAWFQLAPIGYGTLGFLDGALFALFFAAGYCVLRLAGTPRLLAGAALALAVIVLIYNLVYSVGNLPAQHGPLRFGLPMLVIVAAAVEARWPRRAGAARAAQLAVVGLASIWALEALAYTVATYAAIVCFQAWVRPVRRLAWVTRRAVLALAACVAAQLVLVAATLAFAGQLPDYGWYLAFLHSFLLGNVGDITYDFSPWSPGLPVGVAYGASAIAFVLLVRRRPDIVQREPTAMVVLCATTAYGIALFSYFDNRSADHILPYVSLPALLAGTLWLSLLLRGALGGSRPSRLGGLAFALALSVLLTSVAWSSIGQRFSRSALGHVVPGGDSMSAALHRLWNLPPLSPGTPQGEHLLNRYMHGEPRVLTVVSPNLETEILFRTGRVNQLPLSYPPEDSFVSSQYLPSLRQAVGELQPGDRLLTQVLGLKAFAAFRAQPSRDPLTEPAAPGQLSPLQEVALKLIGERFRLRVIHRDDQGFVVATLVARE